MLELRNIKKIYPAGDGQVIALKDISLQFRTSEFVSILGPSGCGKTTMLNIIGGLDGYTDGDLIINGISTKQYKDRDWDSYRNHSIGFVFQSYNLIPHQSVLQNVELALTLSGVSKAERRARAKQALEEVGLGNQLNKRPNEMSGGQMQRVAIARALVNDPDIILADEPTGALDTETSLQVMEILKRISKNRLIIMVTHNPELANNYSTRIINMLDGEITHDSYPLTEDEIHAQRMVEEEQIKKAGKRKKEKKPSMSFGTSFMLSLKNLFTKKGRTILTSFAGSIGIIGIALILAVSQGTTAYIDSVQESTLASYPLTLEATTVDLTTLMQTFMSVSESTATHPNDAVYKKTALFDIVNAVGNMEETENDLKSFKQYLINQMKDPESSLTQAINGIQYSYDFDLLIYTKNVDGRIIQSDAQKLLQELIMKHMKIDMTSMSNMEEMASMNPMMSMGGMSTGIWQELLPGDNGAPINDLLYDQYELAYGAWPNSYNEIVLVLDENNELDDVTLYALGLLPEEEIDNLASVAINGGTLEAKDTKWSYQEICEREYRTVLNADRYDKNKKAGTYTDLSETEQGLQILYDKHSIPLKITGIIRPKEDSDSAMLTGSIGYTSALTEYIIHQSADSAVIAEQKENPNMDILTGLPFDSSTGNLTNEDKETYFRDYLASLNDTDKMQFYTKMCATLPKEQLDTLVNEQLNLYSREQKDQMLTQGFVSQGISNEEIESYLSELTDEELDELMIPFLKESIKQANLKVATEANAAKPPQQLLMELDGLLANTSSEMFGQYYDELMIFSESTLEDNLRDLGCVDLDSPATINLYATSFANKDIIEEAIVNYNNSVDEMQKIEYTDYIGLLLSSVTTIINAITYVLIAFVSISLVVSSIMIGVITLISVQERTKEIGILRAIGASKKNVSRMFNAETMIVGFTSGLLGVVVTYLLCIPINIILYALTDIANLRAFLPLPAALILIAISVILTLISGIIPSRSAAKKDPVVALRTE